MTMITPSYLGETIEYSSLHACRSTLEDPTGESENIVSAAILAKQKGCRLLTFTGFNPANRLRQIGDFNVYVPASHYGYVEMAHSVIAHFVTDTTVMRTTAPD